MASEAPVTPPYADRVIHPLPKRRLRERLSPEAADSIKFPPSGAVGVGSGLFQYPFDTPTSTCRSGSAVAGAADGSPQQSRTVGSRPVIVDQAVSSANLRAVTGNAESSASADTAADDKAAAQPGAGGNGSQNGVTLQLQAQLTRADGYDGSENTNNKKKRKSSGNDMSMAHSGVEVRGGSMQVAATPVCRCEHDHGHRGSCLGSARSSSQYGSADLSGATVSGPGRGKYGRTRSVRNPLSNLPESRSNRLRTNEWFTEPPAESGGIISTAIAEARKDVSSPVSPGKGTILSPSQIGPNPHYSSKFTFTCEGPSKKSVAWPGSDPSTPTSSQSPHTAVPQARSMSGGAPKDGNQVPSQGADKVTGYPPVPPPAANTPPPATSHSGKTLTKATLQTLDQQYPAQPAPPLPSVPAKQHGQESRRQQAREFAAAARARRKKQEAENRRNPPKPDELWICEFCEYESIFGEPPSALIRLYEAKDQRIRAHEAERRRLLEKAKMRGGRKAKKPPKDGKNARRTDPSPAEDAADYAADNGHDDYYAGHADDVHGDLNPEAPSTEAMSRHSSVDNQVLDEFEGEDHPDHPDHLEEAEEEGDYDPLVYDVPNWKQYGVHPDPRHPLTGCCGQLDHGCPLASRPAEGRD